MTTEYQERYCPPRCHTAVPNAKKKDPEPPPKASGAEVTTIKSYYVTQNWIKNPPKPPQQSMSPKRPQRCSSASSMEDYTSMYKKHFQAWKANRRLPLKLSDSLKVSCGLVVPQASHSQKGSVAANSVPQEEKPEPIESITSYRSEYISHPVQPRRLKEKPVYQPIRCLPWAALPPKPPKPPKAALDINQKFFDHANEFLEQFKTWSLETKFCGQGKSKDSSVPSDREFVFTSRTEHKADEPQQTKPILPSVQTSEKSKAPIQMTTMKECYKAWDTPRRFPSVKKTTVSVGTPKPAESSPKPNETAVCDNTDAPENTPAEHGVFSGFESISNGAEECRRFWTTSLDTGATWPDGDIFEEPS